MPRFIVTCRGVFDQNVVAKLDKQGVYFEPGSNVSTHPAGKRLSHHLKVEGEDEMAAEKAARKAVEAAGGHARAFDVEGPAD